MRKSNNIAFEERECEFAAINGKIDDFGMNLLEERYAGTGIFFENDDWEKEAIMSWSESTDNSKVADAKLEFMNFIIPA